MGLQCFRFIGKKATKRMFVCSAAVIPIVHRKIHEQTSIENVQTPEADLAEAGQSTHFYNSILASTAFG
jgi:hypothetical protein